VLKGLGNDLVVNHVAKYNYGLSCNEPFIEAKHLKQDRAFLELPRIWVARNQMEWFLEKVCTDTAAIEEVANLANRGRMSPKILQSATTISLQSRSQAI